MFKKIWKIILVILIVLFIAIALSPVVAEAVAVWFTTAGFPILASLVVGLSNLALPWYVAMGAAVGLAYLIDPATTSEIVTDVADVAVKVGGAVVGALTSVVSSAWPILLLVGAFFLLKGEDGQNRTLVIKPKAKKILDEDAEESDLPPELKGAST